MFQVLGVVRRPATRVGIVAATLSATMLFGGTVLARLPDRVLGTSGVATAASVTTVKLLGKKALNMSAGQTKTLLKIGSVTTRAVCTNAGGSVRRIQIQAKSSKAGAVVASQNGAVALTSAYQTLWTASNAAPSAFGLSYDVVIGTRTFTHYQTDFGVHGATDCGARLAALSD